MDKKLEHLVRICLDEVEKGEAGIHQLEFQNHVYCSIKLFCPYQEKSYKFLPYCKNELKDKIN